MRLAALALMAAVASAHELNVGYEATSRGVFVRAVYGESEPCAYAGVLIYSPADAKSEFQNGRTDARGRFSFQPDQPGSWRFVIDDEQGHRKELWIQVNEAGAPVLAVGAAPMWQKMLTGVALITGITGFLYGWKSRRAG
jgi:nickel transport protein